MRENMGLYRGKRIDNDEWLYGSLLKVTIDGETAWLIFGNAFEFANGGVRSLSHAQVDPNTVGECSGVPDKNGKKIFEGDILRFRYTGENRGVDGVAAVIFEDGKFGVKWGWHSELVALTGFANTSIEIIGNIHDNPELLEAADG